MPASYPLDLARHVHAHLVSRGEKLPDVPTLERLFETLYFASLKREEGEPILCRIAFINRRDPDPKPPTLIVHDRWKCFPLSEDMPFTVRNLIKLSKAVDPWNSTLAVDSDAEDNLRIWGLIDQSVHYSTYVVKETAELPEMPGMFQAAIEGIGEVSVYRTRVLLGSLKQNVLVIKQQRVLQDGPIYIKLRPSVDRFRDEVVECVGSAICQSPDDWEERLEYLWISVICRLLIGIQRYGHGGAVLISSEGVGLNPKYSLAYPRLSEALVRSAAHTIRNAYYSDLIFSRDFDPEATVPANLYLDNVANDMVLQETNNEITGCIRFLSSLSRVDGLIWLDWSLSLQAFGVEITLKDDPGTVLRAENTLGTRLKKLDLNYFGMRHRSMVRYCGTNAQSIGFVVSQDGDVRAITKVKGRVVVWENVRIQSVLIPKSAKDRRGKKK